MKKLIVILTLIIISVLSCSTAHKISSEEINIMTTRIYKKPMKDVYYSTRDMIVEKEFNIIII